MVVKNEDIKELIIEIPDGHMHLRATVKFMDGTKTTFQEATIANIVRAYIDVKTHPTRNKIHLKGTKTVERKEGYAEWQLI